MCVIEQYFNRFDKKLNIVRKIYYKELFYMIIQNKAELLIVILDNLYKK